MNSRMRWERPATVKYLAQHVPPTHPKVPAPPCFSVWLPKRGAGSPGAEPAPRGGGAGRKEEVEGWVYSSAGCGSSEGVLLVRGAGAGREDAVRLAGCEGSVSLAWRAGVG